MKRIILDFYRRWGLGVLVILGAHFILERYAAQRAPGDDFTIKIFTCQVVMFLGFLLSGDLLRGLGKALAILPVPARQSGRALWIASVLLPGVALSIISAACLNLYGQRTWLEIVSPALLKNWAVFPLVLGATFGSFTLLPSSKGEPSVFDRLRAAAGGLNFIFPLASWYYLQKQPHPLAAFVVLAALAFVTGRGWWRAGELISVRAGFRLAATAASRKKTSTLQPAGLGGLRYLVEQTLVRTVLMGVAMMTLIAIVLSFMNRSNQALDFSQSLVAAINGGLTPFIFIIMLSSVPIAQQLRFLRTLPISPLALTSVVVLLPVAALALVGVILALVMVPIAGLTVLFPIINSFASIGGIAAVGMTVVAWRGLDFLSYMFVFLFMVGGPILTLALNLAFSIRTIPPWVSLAVPTVLMALSFAITHRLVGRSSAAYRVRHATLFNWAQMRPS